MSPTVNSKRQNYNDYVGFNGKFMQIGGKKFEP